MRSTLVLIGLLAALPATTGCLQLQDHTLRQRCFAQEQGSRVPCLQIRGRDAQLGCQVENGASPTWCNQIADRTARQRCRLGLN